MRTRHDDESNPMPLDSARPPAPLKITREIPLWGILSVVGALGAQAVALYYGQQALTAKMAEVSAEVRALSAAGRQADVDRVQARYQLDDLARRVNELERRAKP